MWLPFWTLTLSRMSRISSNENVFKTVGLRVQDLLELSQLPIYSSEPYVTKFSQFGEQERAVQLGVLSPS